MLAWSSGEGRACFPAYANPGAGTSGCGAGICDPKIGPKEQAAASSCQGNGKGPPSPSPLTFL